MSRYSFVKVLSNIIHFQSKAITSGWSISRILSGRKPAWAIIYLGRALPRSSVQPTRGYMETSSLPSVLTTISPLLDLAPGGGYLAICISTNAGGLLHHLFTITMMRARRCAVWLFVSVARSGGFPRPGCYPTPCSTECGLSSTLTTQDRDCPTSLRWHHDTRTID